MIMQEYPSSPTLYECFGIGTPSFLSCKVEFYQPSCWLYSVPNFLVFQQLVTLYLGGILVKVVSEIV